MDPDLLRSRSILIYVRSSLILSILLYSCLAAMLYTDLYVHLIKQTRNAFQDLRVLPDGLFLLLTLAALALTFWMKPRLEKVALGLVALNLPILYLRGRMSGPSQRHLALCLLSLILELALLGTLIAFYRKYPNVLKQLRRMTRE
jgi:hypothetical protein